MERFGNVLLCARQLAHSRLAATRAQVDPMLVADTLREVRRRYHAPGAAGTRAAIELMDGLVRYVRLALDRAGDGHGAPRRLALAWLELCALRHGLALHAGPGEVVRLAAGDAALTPALAHDLDAAIGAWAAGRAAILRHGLEAGPDPAYAIQLAAS